MAVSTLVQKLNALQDMTTAVTGSLIGLKVALIVADFAESADLLLADLTLASFNGSTPQAVATWTAPYIDVDGSARVDGGNFLFQPADNVLPQTVYGWCLVNTGVTVLEYVEHLPTPIPLPSTLYGYEAHVSIAYGD